MLGFRTSLALLAFAAAACPLRGDAQIRRCTTLDGEVVFTDRSCADVGGSERPAPAVHSPLYGGKLYARGCSRSVRDLVFEVTAAIDSRDVNRLAGVYNWTGMSSRGGYAVLGRLDDVANRALLAVTPVLPAPQLSLHSDGDVVVSGGVSARAYPGAAVIRRQPIALRVDQVLAGGTPASTTFGLRRHMGCWWIAL